MKRVFLISVSVLALAACQQTPLDTPPGKYESTTSSTDVNGTTVTHKSSTAVSVDDYGNKTAVVKSKTTEDPKGLFNKKTTSESKEVIKEQ